MYFLKQQKENLLLQTGGRTIFNPGIWHRNDKHHNVQYRNVRRLMKNDPPTFAQNMNTSTRNTVHTRHFFYSITITALPSFLLPLSPPTDQSAMIEYEPKQSLESLDTDQLDSS